MKMIKIVAIALVAAVQVLPASAQSVPQSAADIPVSVKLACQADFEALCKTATPGEGRVVKCMKDNEAKLNAACKSAFGAWFATLKK